MVEGAVVVEGAVEVEVAAADAVVKLEQVDVAEDLLRRPQDVTIHDGQSRHHFRRWETEHHRYDHCVNPHAQCKHHPSDRL